MQFKRTGNQVETFNIYKALIPSAEIESGQKRTKSTELVKESTEYRFIEDLFKRTFDKRGGHQPHARIAPGP